MSFIQIIEFTTSRAEELEALFDEWLEKTGARLLLLPAGTVPLRKMFASS